MFMEEGLPVEWNFGGCGGQCGGYDALGGITHDALEAWPRSVPIDVIGLEAGVNVHTGWALVGGHPKVSPCRHAYLRFCDQVRTAHALTPHPNVEDRSI